ncbi:MAG TPA: class I SAM-dependent methyltransferase [Gemmatimonadales bacterium]|jgi:SAM-dependent methyltransferase|nr:class I SAM-dependent methyltransferase [Gemmatimonadales bacterium]
MSHHGPIVHFSSVAGAYAAYRPTYPTRLFDWLAAEAPAHDLAWDCGAGSGQASRALAERFALVVATDASHAQLAAGERIPRVHVWAAPAERSGIRSGRANLIAVAQALHWFDLNAFYQEVRRVMRPGGLLAVWTYADPKLDGAPGRALAEFAVRVRAYWPAGRSLVDSGYRTIPFPFAERAVPAFAMTAEWPLDAVVGYVGTWSAVGAYRAAHRDDPTVRLRDELRRTWGDPAQPRRLTWSLSVRAARV